jgi:isoquinoline 1-oxidoreductase beta subunit
MVEKDKGRDAFAFQGVSAANLLGGEYALQYTIPNLLIDHAMRNTHVPPGVWRGVNINQNCIFMECFMDELAQAAGQDELEFRRKLMANHPKALAVLNAVAARIGWGKPAPQGVHRGLAHMKAFNAYVAAAAEVSVASGNRIKIHRIVAATDPIHAVNPAQIERQVAGSFVYGLSAVFYGGCTVDKGRIVEGNFDTYDSMRIAQMPPVETIVMPSGGNDPWGGIGEPTICVAAPAVLNAYAKATGQRIRTFPLKNQRVRMA